MPRRDQPPPVAGSIWADILAAYDAGDPTLAKHTNIERVHGVLDAFVQAVGDQFAVVRDDWDFRFEGRPDIRVRGDAWGLSFVLQARQSGVLIYRDRIIYENKVPHLVLNGDWHFEDVHDGFDSETGQDYPLRRITVENLEENPLEAFLSDLKHTITVATVNGPRIKENPGTTLTAYPDPNPETTTVDGFLQWWSGGTWATAVGAAGDGSDDTNTSHIAIRIRSNASNWSQLYRSAYLYDTSSIGTDNIDDATISFRGTGKSDGLGITPNVAVCSSAPASNTALVAGDYDSLGTTDFATRITYSGWSTTGYNDFTLNAAGEAAIDKGGVSKFGVRNGQYDLDNSEPTWTANLTSDINCYGADQGGTANDPKLVVNHTAGGGVTLTQIERHYPRGAMRGARGAI